MDQLLHEFERLVTSRIEQVRDNLAAGMLSELSEYKRLTGRISGLQEATMLLEEARQNILKR